MKAKFGKKESEKLFPCGGGEVKESITYTYIIIALFEAKYKYIYISLKLI